jgi:hypothetical protein
MNTNALTLTLTRFYTAFAALDADTMASCYAPEPADWEWRYKAACRRCLPPGWNSRVYLPGAYPSLRFLIW